jgi:hypothetical protein
MGDQGQSIAHRGADCQEGRIWIPRLCVSEVGKNDGDAPWGNLLGRSLLTVFSSRLFSANQIAGDLSFLFSGIPLAGYSLLLTPHSSLFTQLAPPVPSKSQEHT